MTIIHNIYRRLSKDTEETSLMDSMDLGSPIKADPPKVPMLTTSSPAGSPTEANPNQQSPMATSHHSSPEGATADSTDKPPSGDSIAQCSPYAGSCVPLEQEPHFGDLMSAMTELLQKKVVCIKH